MIYVIGSGPAGVSGAVALVRQGHEVTMLDAGLELEPERREIVDELTVQDSNDWEVSKLERLKESMEPSATGVALKLSYGSDFPYRETKTYLPRELKNAAVLSSLARGGLSNVWGAAVLPYSAEDISDWPITLKELEPHYRAVFSFMSLSAARDDLQSRFPLYSDARQSMLANRQVASFLKDLEEHGSKLKAAGFLFGSSRLAVYSRNSSAHECAACGLCLYGCPYELIYNSTVTLEDLRRRPNFTYVPGVLVEKLEETSDWVRIIGHRPAKREQLNFEASRVYIGAGVLSSTKLILNSLEAYERILTLRDSQYFILPLLRYRGVPGVVDERMHTLAQAFIEIDDLGLSEKTIHLQIYGYNDLFEKALQNSFGRFYPVSRLAANTFLNRFLLIQGYLHSDSSETISLKLTAPHGHSQSRLILEGENKRHSRQVVRKLVSKLVRHRGSLRAIPLRNLLKIGRPGEGNHSGGSLPMKTTPGEFETDSAGRPSGFKRVHLIDASIFPTIPATTITLSIMANAHRIASAHADY